MTKKQLQKIILKLSKSYRYEIAETEETTVLISFYHMYSGQDQLVSQWIFDKTFFQFYLKDQLINLK